MGFGLPSLQSFIVCVIGNMIPVPFIYWFARRVLEWGKDKRFIGKFLHGVWIKESAVAKAYGEVRCRCIYCTASV